MRGIFMEMKEKAETEIIDYKRIFYGSADAKPDKSAIKKEREKRFAKVFAIQLTICLAIIFSALILRYAQPETFESVSSVLNGLYEDNITLSDLNYLINERVANNDAIAAFFNFAPAQD